MTTASEAHVLVLEMPASLKVGSLNKKRWDDLSPTFRETRLNLDGVPIWVKYQSWIEPEAVTAAVENWLREMSPLAIN
jgi:hypothetical protein